MVDPCCCFALVRAHACSCFDQHEGKLARWAAPTTSKNKLEKEARQNLTWTNYNKLICLNVQLTWLGLLRVQQAPSLAVDHQPQRCQGISAKSQICRGTKTTEMGRRQRHPRQVNSCETYVKYVWNICFVILYNFIAPFGMHFLQALERLEYGWIWQHMRSSFGILCQSGTASSVVVPKSNSLSTSSASKSSETKEESRTARRNLN